MTKAGMLRLTAIGLIACIAMGGVLAATGAADPIAQTAASVAKNVKKALRIGKRADRKATNALKTARRAEKAAVGCFFAQAMMFFESATISSSSVTSTGTVVLPVSFFTARRPEVRFMKSGKMSQP